MKRRTLKKLVSQLRQPFLLTVFLVVGGLFGLYVFQKLFHSRATATPQADFNVQRGCSIAGTSDSTITLTAGSEYTAPTDTTKTFIRIVNTRITGTGQTSGGGTQNLDRFTWAFSDPDFAGGSVTLARSNTAQNSRVCWEIIEYVGSVSGANEVKVLDQGTVTYTNTNSTVDGSAVSGVSDDADIVVLITGQSNGNSNSTTWNSSNSTAEWLSGTDTPRFTRAATSGANSVSYVVLEFTGSNWTTQRVEHNYSAAGSTETETISDVGALDRTLLFTQHRTGTPGLDEQGSEAWLSSTTQASFLLQGGATTPSGIYTVMWIVSNSDTDSNTKLIAEHISGSRAASGASEGAANEEDEWSETITAVRATNEASIVGENGRSSGGGTAYPRGSVSLYLNSTTSVKLWQSDDGQTQTYRFSVISWPRTDVASTDVTATTNGSQDSAINTGTNSYLGGSFVISPTSSSFDVTSITLTEAGTIDASTNLTNIKLFYEMDTSAPYDCASESYAGTESQFGSTDTDGFTAANGTSTFSGTVGITTTSVMCVYPIMDILESASGGDTISITIDDPSSDIVVSSSGTVEPDTTLSLGSTAISGWYNEDWVNRKSLLLDKDKVSGSSDFTDYPVLISFTDTDLITNAQSNGNDILFTSADGSTKLSHEIESFNSSTGEIIAWVKLPTLSASSDTTIFMYYGNASASNQEDAANVWPSSTGAIWHMSENPTASAPQVLDSTNNNNDGTSYGSMTSNDSVSGQVGNGINFDGNDDYVYVNDTASLRPVTNLTLQAWVYLESVPDTSANAATILEKGLNDADNYNFYIFDTGEMGLEYRNSSNVLSYNSDGNTAVSLNTWQKVTMVFDDTNNFVHFYVNTSNTGSEAETNSLNSSLSNELIIGMQNYGLNNMQFDGTIDELRIFHEAMSADWIYTSYNIESSQGTDAGAFIKTLGTQEGDSGWYSANWPYRKKLTLDESMVVGSSDFTDFPVLISFSDSDVAVEALQNGDDILFTSDDGSTKLSHEIESYTASTGTLVAWVKIPTLGATTDTEIYMYYGNLDATNQEDVENTWNSNYQMVQHLDETSGTHYDSTSTNNDSTTVTVTTQGAATGQINGTDDFNGSNNEIIVNHASSLDITGDFTISGWFKDDNSSFNHNTSYIITKGNSDVTEDIPYLMYIEWDDIFFGSRPNWAYSGVSYDLTTSHSTSEWIYATGIYTSSTNQVTLYINGQSVAGPTTLSTAPQAGGANLFIGSRDTSNFWTGQLDELRVLNDDLTADWIQTEYNNQANQGTGSGKFISSVASQEVYGWYSDQWSGRKRLTLNSDLVSGSTALTNFPVLISFTDAALITEAQTDGDDILFTSNNGTTKLNHELERYDSSTGTIVAWVNVPTLSATNDTNIYMYYGNPAASNQESIATTWNANYQLVWHLEEDPSGSAPQAVDSTLNTNNGTSNGLFTSDLITAQIFKGISFADNSQYYTTSDSSTISGLSALTFSMWFNADSWPTSGFHYLGGKSNWADNHEYRMRIEDNRLEWHVSDDGSTTSEIGVATSTVSSGDWHYLVGTYDSSTDSQLMFIDGSQVDSTTFTSSGLYNGSSNFTMGTSGDDGGGTSDDFWGSLDEVRVANTALSSDWIATEYNNQTNQGIGPTKFIKLAGYQEGTAEWYSTSWLHRKRIVLDSNLVDGSTDLLEFPVLIAFTDSDIQSAAQADGDDFLFTASDGTTKLSHEIEQYDSSTGELFIWVNIPVLGATDDTIIYLYYGNDGATNQEDVAGTWNDNYLAVYHLEENVTDGGSISNVHIDSTGNGYDGDQSGNAETTSPIYLGQNTGFGEYIDLGNNGFLENTTNFTLSAWIKRGSTFGKALLGNELSNYSDGINIQYWTDGDVYVSPGDAEFVGLASNDTNWHHTVFVYDGTQTADADEAKIYYDGSLGTPTTVDSIGDVSSSPGINFYIGALRTDDTSNNASFDEVRLMTNSVSSGWAITEYNNQTNQGTGTGKFIKNLGIEENAGSSEETPSNEQLMRHGDWFNLSGIRQFFGF